MSIENEIKIMQYCDVLLSYLDKNKNRISIVDAFNELDIPAQLQSDIIELLINNEHIVRTGVGQNEYIQISTAGATFVHTSSYMEGWKAQLIEEDKKAFRDVKTLKFTGTNLKLIAAIIIFVVIAMLILGSK